MTNLLQSLLTTSQKWHKNSPTLESNSTFQGHANGSSPSAVVAVLAVSIITSSIIPVPLSSPVFVPLPSPPRHVSRFHVHVDRVL